jgi:putative spermidine/putrescine transport system permease protein
MIGKNSISRGAVLRTGFVVSCLTLLVIPLLLIVPMSFSAGSYLSFPPREYSLRWYMRVLTDAEWLAAGVESLQVALLTMCVATVIGTLAAFFIVRARLPGKGAIYALIISPIIVPPMLIAIGTYRVWADLHLVNTTTGLVIAHTCLGIPLVATSVAAVIGTLENRLEDAAASLGANPWHTFWQVTLPIIRPGIVTGALFAFITSFDEIVIAMFISGTDSVTLPKKLWDGVRYQIDPSVAVIATIMMAIEIAVFIIMILARLRANQRVTAS